MDRRMGRGLFHRRPLTSVPGFGARARRLALVVPALILVGGCVEIPGEPLSDGIQAVNETQETIHFEVIGEGDERFRLSAEFEPGQGGLVIRGSAIGPSSLITENGCTTGDLIALDAAGKEIARHPPPMCAGYVFIVGAQPGSQPP